jgi:hypothetical protein
MLHQFNRRRFLAGAAALPLVSTLHAAPAEAAPAIDIPDTRAGRHLAWTIEQLNSGGEGLTTDEVAERFTPLYLSGLPPQGIIDTFAILQPVMSPVRLARLEGGATDQHAYALLRTKDGYWRVRLALEFDAPYRINDYFFEAVAIPEPPERPRSWDGITSRFKKIAPSASYLAAEIVGGQPQHISGYRVDASTPIASAFKLYVLATLAAQIETGEHAWSDRITLRDSLRSLPSGSLYYEPAGSSYPLEYIAERMIAESDNTATDHAMAAAGREAIEANLARFGHTDPLSTQPFLMTREWFAMRMRFTEEQIDDYVDASIPERRAILDDTVAPIADTLLEWEPWPGPAESDRIEWFASAADLTRVMSHLQQFATTELTAPVAQALGLNPGIPFDPEDWAYVGFKEGYETGLKAMTWLLRRHDGRWFTLIGIIHDKKQEIDGAQLRELMVAAAKLLAEYP